MDESTSTTALGGDESSQTDADMETGRTERDPPTGSVETVTPGINGTVGGLEENLEADETPATITGGSGTILEATVTPITSELVVNQDEEYERIEEELREQREQLNQMIEEREHTAVAEPLDSGEKAPGMACSRRRKWMVISGLVLLAIVGIVLGVVLLPRPAPPPPLPEELEGLLSSVSLDGGAALRTTSTPQNKALLWLADNLKIDEYSDEQKIQRYVLATLYYSTNGPEWEEKANWMRNENECNWYNEAEGPFCSDDGAIIELDMWKNFIHGTLPDEIALLSDSLIELNFGANHLRGQVPSTLIGHLTNLQYMSLHDTYLTGTIPSEVGLWSSLTTLSLSVNALTGTIPSEIELLTRLESLRLYGNNFNSPFDCPSWIGDCRVSCEDKEDVSCRSLS